VWRVREQKEGVTEVSVNILSYMTRSSEEAHRTRPNGFAASHRDLREATAGSEPEALKLGTTFTSVLDKLDDRDFNWLLDT
jgi:hypothetical protein